MKYVVLGASGFIGGVVTRYLRQIDDARVIPLSTANIDLRYKPDAAKKLAIYLSNSTLIHAAGIPRLRADDMASLKDNLAINENVLNACEIAPPERIVFLSSVEVYGSPKKLPISEVTETHPDRLYGVSKILGELLFRRWAANESVPLCILRLPGVYGPSDNDRGFVGALNGCIRDGRTFTLTGHGNSLRDYIFANDVGRAVIEVVPKVDAQEIFNFASGNSINLNQIIELMHRQIGNCPIDRSRKDIVRQDLKFDSAKLEGTAPNFRFTPLKEGILKYSNSTETAP